MLRATRAWIAWFREGSIVDPALGPVRGSSSVATAGTPDRVDDAVTNFWSSIDALLEPFAQGDRALMPMWLEYWAVRTRAGKLEPLREMLGLLVEFVTELVGEAGADLAEERARAVSAYLFGTAMQELVDPLELTTLHRDVASLCGMSPPSAHRAGG